MRLDRLQSFDYHVFYAMHHSLEVNANLIEVVLELGQVPLRCILSILVGLLGLLAPVSPRILNIVFILLVDRVVGEMNIPLVDILLTICVLLRREPGEAFLEEVHLKWVKSGDKCIYA